MVDRLCCWTERGWLGPVAAGRIPCHGDRMVIADGRTDLEKLREFLALGTAAARTKGSEAR